MILIKITQKIEYISQLYDHNLISKLNLNNVPCPICGSIHAILVEGMIPFTSITFDEVVDFLLDVDNSDYPYLRYFIDFYFVHIDLDYESFCVVRTKNIPFCFIHHFST